jgi:hypothetical protein
MKLPVRQFFAVNQILVFENPPTWMCIVSFIFFKFPMLKYSLKGSHFESVEHLQSNVTTELIGLTLDMISVVSTRNKEAEICV